MSVPGRLVNFTGNWLMDVEASHPLDALLAYHGLQQTGATPSLAQAAAAAAAAATEHTANTTTITTKVDADGQMHQTTRSGPMQADALLAAAPVPSLPSPSSPLASVLETEGDELSPKDSATEAAAAAAATTPPAAPSPPASIPALIVQHSVRRLTTYLHALIPRYDAAGNLVRYDPAVTNSRLAVHEEYRLDGQYHTVRTARGPVEARAYHAPHGQSLIVDQRCASKYDLERTERFLEDEGRKLIIEIRILSCAPEVQADRDAPATAGVSSKFAGSATPGKPATAAGLVVKELLFIRRVFNRIVDARAAAAEAADSAATTSTQSNAPAATAAASTTSAARSQDDVSEQALTTAAAVESSLQRAAAAPAAAPALADKTPNLRAALTPAALSVLPGDLAQVSLAGCNSGESAFSAPFSLTALLYPRNFLLKRYQLTDLLEDRRAASHSAGVNAATSPAAVAKEQSAYTRARASMMLVDGLLLLLLLLLLLHHFGSLFGVDEKALQARLPKLDTSGVSRGVEELLHSDAVEGVLHRGSGVVDWMREQLFPTIVSSTAVIPAPAVAVVPAESVS